MESYLELCNYYYNKYKDSIKKSDYNYTVSYRIIYTYDKEKNVVIGIAYHINNKNEYEFSNIYIFLRNKKCITRLEGSGSVYELSAKSICEILDIECFNNSNYLRPFFELFGEYVFLKGSVPHKTNDLKSLKSFYKNKELVRKNNKNQRIIDELISINLRKYKISDFKVKAESINVYNNWWMEDKAYVSSKIEKLEGSMFVIRMFFIGNELTEAFRMYIDDDNIVKCRRNSFGEWVSAKTVNNELYQFAFDTDELGPEFYNTRLKYYMDILKNESYNKLCGIQFLILLIDNPVIEQLCKTELAPFILKNMSRLIRNINSIDEYLKDIFGYYNPKEKKLLKKLGLNSYQFQKVCKLFNSENEFFKESIEDSYFRVNALWECVKLLLKGDISNIDNKTFDTVVNTFFEMTIYDNLSISEFKYSISKLFIIGKNINYICDTYIKLSKIERESRTKNSYIQPFLEYDDFLRMVINLNSNSNLNYDISFNDYSELYLKHNEVIEIVNSLRNDVDTDAFKENQKIWAKYEFRDDNFIIIFPKIPEDLVREGIALNHCVKSYIEAVAKRKTNIFFLRKTEEINIPYITIELTNDNYIRQAHGINNSEIDPNSAEYAFIKKWANKNDIKLGNINNVLAVRYE